MPKHRDLMTVDEEDVLAAFFNNLLQVTIDVFVVVIDRFYKHLLI
jgi:choline kinase